jgi:hypothetical protein
VGGGVADEVLGDEVLEELQVGGLQVEGGGQHERLELVEQRQHWGSLLADELREEQSGERLHYLSFISSQ